MSNGDASEDRLKDIRRRLRQFVAERDWSQFHDPKNLAMALASEAGELVAELRWVNGEAADQFVQATEHRSQIENEVADVAITLLLFCDRAGIDLFDAVERKMTLNSQHYPAAASKGRSGRPADLG